MRCAVTVKLFGGDFNMVEEKSFIQSPIFKLLSICRVLPYGVKFIRLTLHPKGRLFCIRKALQYSLLLFLRRQIFLHGAHIFQSFSPHVCALSLPLLSSFFSLLIAQKLFFFFFFNRTENILISQSTGCAWLCYIQTKNKTRNKGCKVHYFSD